MAKAIILNRHEKTSEGWDIYVTQEYNPAGDFGHIKGVIFKGNEILWCGESGGMPPDGSLSRKGVLHFYTITSALRQLRERLQ